MSIEQPRAVAITGAARGIGKATAHAFTRAGARVAIGDLDAALAEKAAAEVGSGAVGLALDVTDRASVDAFVAAAEDALGPLDVYVNNAGIMPIGHFLAEDDVVAHRQIDINIHGVLYGVKAVLPGMIDRGRGHIVNVASGAGKIAVPGGVTYAGTKHAVVGISESLRIEFRTSGVGFSVVMPAIVNTDLTTGIKSAKGMKNVEPEDVAAAIVDAVQTGRFDVYVPRQMGRLVRLQAMLPRRVREPIGRVMGVETAMLDVDESSRAAYRARIGETPAQGQLDAPADVGAPPAE
jgi:NADP-dependent 3-hydroxy acid dehydrogenase YdfG